MSWKTCHLNLSKHYKKQASPVSVSARQPGRFNILRRKLKYIMNVRVSCGYKLYEIQIFHFHNKQSYSSLYIYISINQLYSKAVLSWILKFWLVLVILENL